MSAEANLVKSDVTDMQAASTPIVETQDSAETVSAIKRPDFTPAQLKTIEHIGSQLDLRRPESFQLIDQELLKKRSESSKVVLKDLMAKKGSAANQILSDLLNTINGIDPGEDKRNFVMKWISKSKDKITLLKQQYQSVSKNIDDLENSLKQRANDHNEDAKRCDVRIREIKESYVQESMIFEAMNQFLEKSKGLRPSLVEKATDNNPLGIQNLQRYDDVIRQVERKRNDVHDTLVSLTQDLQVQYITQQNIRNIYSGIHDAIFVQLTEFRNLFTDTLASENLIETNRQLNATRQGTTNLRTKRAERLNTATVKTYETIEQGSYDISSFVETQRKLTQSIVQVREIQQRMDAKRKEEIKELNAAIEEHNNVVRGSGQPTIRHEDTSMLEGF